MKVADLIAALDLPATAQVDQRVPKRLLVAHGAPTAGDKRRITEGIEEVHWLAALKPTTIGVPVFRDEVREYLEIAVLSAELRPGGKTGRLTELIHRAVPYPVFLIATHGKTLALSLTHKRWSQGEAGATVLDGDLVVVEFASEEPDGFGQTFRESLSLARQPRAQMHALYQGWLDTVLALLAARVTGIFTRAESPGRAAARQKALRECARLEAERTRLLAAAAKERQVARQVALNLELRRVEHQRAVTRRQL